jgi:protein-S-isoprenylcysteine O-methyltransferase Ste14
MTQASHDASSRPASGGELAGYLSIVITVIVMAVLLFWPAGTIDWRRAWLFLTLFVVLIFVAMSWIKRDNPELIKVRQKYQKGTKGWDAVVATLSVILFALILPVAGFDERFKWAIAPDWVTLLGYAFLTAGFMGTTWAQSVNRHFEATVRIQTDRDHKVIDTGPYAYIRHPGYAFGLLMAAGCALSLGSFTALVPVGLAMIALVGRTLGEEGVLIEGLPGYREYKARVKWRWLPFVW